MKIISKSRFVSGMQCEKKLYFDIYRKDLKPAISPQQEILFTTGHNIGNLAQQLFPQGKDASPENYYDFSASIQQTAEWITSGVQTIYEAAFTADGVLAALDILHHVNNERWAIEVKSSAEIKEYHLQDASLQYWVMEKSGFKPDKFFLMHIDNTYIKNGPIEVSGLFKLVDITEKVMENQNWVEAHLNALKKMLQNKTEPSKEIGKHCDAPFSCDYKHHCWKHVPKNSVFDLFRPGGKDWLLYEKGILRLEDIPEEEPLNKRQQLQVEGAKNNTDFIDKMAIQKFMASFQYPLYFFDFETVFPAVPPINGARPFQQTPFQYSLHIIENPNGTIIHKEFLADPRQFDEDAATDPRIELLQQLQKDIGPTGSIVAYNANFEIGVLKNLAELFPTYSDFINVLCERFVDLLVPFQNSMYYLPAMGKSASIKSVLPAIAPAFSYDELDINNGGVASDTFLSMINKRFIGNETETRAHLLKYCERDTYGMVIIWNHLCQIMQQAEL
jgi:CRISPR/Cas system-associated exonuclease Cas4 (RecB family)